jgi:hypothetical protein
MKSANGTRKQASNLNSMGLHRRSIPNQRNKYALNKQPTAVSKNVAKLTVRPSLTGVVFIKSDMISHYALLSFGMFCVQEIRRGILYSLTFS